MAFIKDPITGMMVYVKNNKLTVIPETDALNNYANVGCVRTFGENDNGEVTGVKMTAYGGQPLDVSSFNAAAAALK